MIRTILCSPVQLQLEGSTPSQKVHGTVVICTFSKPVPCFGKLRIFIHFSDWHSIVQMHRFDPTWPQHGLHLAPTSAHFGSPLGASSTRREATRIQMQGTTKVPKAIRIRPKSLLYKESAVPSQFQLQDIDLDICELWVQFMLTAWFSPVKDPANHHCILLQRASALFGTVAPPKCRSAAD